METMGAVAVFRVIILQFVTLFQLYIQRQNTLELAQGIAHAYGNIAETMQNVADIPEVLKELGIGNVQLMPQKPLGHVLFEKFIERLNPKNIITETNEPNSWPEEEAKQ